MEIAKSAQKTALAGHGVTLCVCVVGTKSDTPTPPLVRFQLNSVMSSAAPFEP